MNGRAGPDWGLGTYERTAQALLPAAQALVDAAALTPAERVLDLGCGTGNVALLAARLGAPTWAVDPAERLRSVTAGASTSEGLRVEVLAGDAQAIPLADASVDVVLSNFAIIFDPDPVAAVAEVMRVLAPGGRLLFTAWLPDGTVSEMVRTCMGLVGQATGQPPRRPFPWHDTEALAELFAPHGRTVSTALRTLPFTGKSPQAYLDAELSSHPLALAGLEVLERQGIAERAREELLGILTSGNEDPQAFRATSRYVLVSA